MSGTQARPVVVSQEAKLQKLKMRLLEGPSTQPVTEVSGILTSFPSQASTVRTIRHYLRSTPCYHVTPRGGDDMYQLQPAPYYI